jgi:hypothetical protein
MLHRTSDGVEEVKLIDFGIAKLKSPLAAPGTEAPRLAGTVAYMAPEQLRAEPLSAASDVYSLGVIAYEMVTGRKPFETSSPFVMPELQRAGVAEPPRNLRPDLPEVAQAAILKSLSFDPADRYQSAREFGDTLADALIAESKQRRASQTRAEPEPHAAYKTPRPRDAEGHRAAPRPALAAMLLLAACAAAALAVWGVRSEDGNKNVNVDGDGVQVTPPPRLDLSYWLEVQKYRGGKPYGTPFRLPGEIIFEKDYRMWLGVSAEQTIRLYVVNEGPRTSPDRPDYNLLFPLPTTNGGTSLFQAGREVKIPEGSPFRFDGQEGTERLWLICSARPIPELEAASGVVAETRNVEIGDPAQARAVQDFISLHASPTPQVKKRESLTSVSSESDVMVHEIKLEHH